jgi:hypothetical protein
MSIRYLPVFVQIALCFLISACNSKNHGIIGQWKREKLHLLEGFEMLDSNWGNITFYPDSTFFIQGQSNQDSAGASLPGWNAGGNTKGTWRLGDSLLFLQLEPKEASMALTYKIIRMTERQLILNSALSGKDFKKDYMEYSRVR